MEYKLPNVFNAAKIISSEIIDGSMDQRGIGENLPIFLKKYKVKFPVAYCQQVHGNEIKIISKKGFYENCDGIITGESVALLIKSADCIPLFFLEPKSKIIGAIHVGRRSLLAGIISNSLKERFKELALSPSGINFFIGPHIRSKNYEIGGDVIGSLPNGFSRFIIKKDSRNFFDLTSCLISELESIGVQRGSIFDSGVDSFDSPQLFSYRRCKEGLFVTLIEKV